MSAGMALNAMLIKLAPSDRCKTGLAKQHQIRPALTGAPLIIYGRKCEVARPTRLAALFSLKNKAQRSAPTDRGLCKEVQDPLRSNFAG